MTHDTQISEKEKSSLNLHFTKKGALIGLVAYVIVALIVFWVFFK